MPNFVLNLNFIEMKNIFFLFILLFLGACSSVPIISNTKKTNLENSQWVLEDNNIVNSNEITLSIEKGKISGNASCNNYFGNLHYEASTNKFSINNLGVTRMHCPKMSTENNFLGILEKVNKYQLKQDYLELYKDQILLLKFKKK